MLNELTVIPNCHFIICVIDKCSIEDLKSLSFGYLGNCYTLHFKPVSWADSFANCKSKERILAVMKTKKAINDISLNIRNVHGESVYYWIGLRRFQWKILDKAGTGT